MNAASRARQSLEARAPRAVVIGASAGGVAALTGLLGALPRPLAVPVLVVLHIAASSKPQWSLVFHASVAPVREVEDKDVAEPGTVLICPPDYHLLVDVGGTLSLSADERVNMARPSIDVLFESAAWAFGAALLGVVLTGANADGAAGLAAIRAVGGSCWVQVPETAAAPAMPRAALAAVPDAEVLTLQEMADALAAQVA